MNLKPRSRSPKPWSSKSRNCAKTTRACWKSTTWSRRTCSSRTRDSSSWRRWVITSSSCRNWRRSWGRRMSSWRCMRWGVRSRGGCCRSWIRILIRRRRSWLGIRTLWVNSFREWMVYCKKPMTSCDTRTYNYNSCSRNISIASSNHSPPHTSSPSVSATLSSLNISLSYSKRSPKLISWWIGLQRLRISIVRRWVGWGSVSVNIRVIERHCRRGWLGCRRIRWGRTRRGRGWRNRWGRWRRRMGGWGKR